MNSLYFAIRYTYTDINDNQFQLRDNSDGKGIFISEWTYSDTPPDPVELLKSVEHLELDKLANEGVDGLQYLSKTDWYVIRFIEAHTKIPDGIDEKRAYARQAVHQAREMHLIPKNGRHLAPKKEKKDKK